MPMGEYVQSYEGYLRIRERSEATIQKYIHDIRCFLEQYGICEAETMEKTKVIAWKHHMEASYAPSTVNAAIAAVNGFLEFLGRSDCKVTPLKVQPVAFRAQRKELTRAEYERLLKAAAHVSEQTACMLETICSTGIRVSELCFITVEAVRHGMAIIRNKGKSRTVFLPTKLCERLKKFCAQNSLHTGSIFLDRKGRPLSRFAIWRRMKKLCATANVAQEKVFPHNLRHLFAVCFYRMQHDLEHLASILGHSSINTTRIYTKSSGDACRRQLDRLNLLR